MANDTPIRLCRNHWCIGAPAGREVTAGHAFDDRLGYRVVVKFSDSNRLNSLSVEAARAVVETLRDQRGGNEDALFLASQIDREADCCARLNAGWAAIGRPSGGFDSQVHGRA